MYKCHRQLHTVCPAAPIVNGGIAKSQCRRLYNASSRSRKRPFRGVMPVAAHISP
nr:MAG TPA: hypothetical protein [Caudoviricetes sp.]